MVDEPAHYSQSIVQLLGMVVRATSHRPAGAGDAAGNAGGWRSGGG
jgi:hypothetical protein